MENEKKLKVPYGALICISGHKRSGKDTFATMLQYLIAKEAMEVKGIGTGISEEELLESLKKSDRPSFNGVYFSVRKSFADKLYNMVAQLTNLDIPFLKNNKDTALYQPITGKIYFEKDLEEGEFTIYDKEGKEDDYTLQDLITIRVLLKDISNNGVKVKFPKIFINALKVNFDMAPFGDRLPWIIPDMRTEDEYLSFRQEGFYIRIERKETKHLSDDIDMELEDMPFDVKLSNDKGLEYLFDRAKDVYAQIKERYGYK